MSYKAGIIKAITELKDRTGSSSIAIKKHMQANMGDKKWLNGVFLKALKDGVASGEFVKRKASYKLSAAAKTAAKKKAAPKKKASPKKKAVPKEEEGEEDNAYAGDESTVFLYGSVFDKTTVTWPGPRHVVRRSSTSNADVPGVVVVSSDSLSDY